TAIKRGGAPVTLPATLQRGQQFDVTVTATPGARMGALKGRIVVHSNVPGVPDQNVAITGTATAATIATTDVHFGVIDIDDPTVHTQNVVIMNNGTGTLKIASVKTMTAAPA